MLNNVLAGILCERLEKGRSLLSQIITINIQNLIDYFFEI